MNVSTLQELSIQTIYNLCLNCQNQLDARDILAKLTSPVLAEISEFLFFLYRFWDAFTFYTHMFLLFYNGWRMFLHLFFNFVINAGYQTKREILNE